MNKELCPNCEAPFSDLQMMGVGGNQASPRFQCGSIFVPVAKRLVVKTYACMKIAELRASIAKPAAVPEAVAKDVSDSALLKAYTTETGKVLPHSWRPIFLDYARIGIKAALLSAADTEVKNG